MKQKQTVLGVVGFYLLVLGMFMADAKPAEFPKGKLRIMIDKVNGTEHLEEEEFARVAKIGFNVICPRAGGNDPVRSMRGARFAQKYGMSYMGWLRGSLRTRDEKDRYTLESGFSFDICSPNSERFFSTMRREILNLAKLSVNYPVLGAFMDFEIYARPLPKQWPGHCYNYSFDDYSIHKFLATKKIAMHPLKPEERADFLRKHGNLDEYCSWQLDSWRCKLKMLRKEIDNINPNFRFAIYPTPLFTRYLKEAFFPIMSTVHAPALCAEHYTYAKGGPNKDSIKEYWKITDTEGLRLNDQCIRNRNNYYQRMYVPFEVIAGLDPCCDGGRNPRFMGATAVRMAKLCGGYWVFYEGIEKDSDLAKDFDLWFSRANQAIADKTFMLNHK